MNTFKNEAELTSTLVNSLRFDLQGTLTEEAVATEGTDNTEDLVEQFNQTPARDEWTRNFRPSRSRMYREEVDMTDALRADAEDPTRDLPASVFFRNLRT